MVQCEVCGYWHGLDENSITIMSHGPHAGSWVCDDCWVGALNLT
ncbi:hypothetical protein [Mycobacterium colombiense]